MGSCHIDHGPGGQYLGFIFIWWGTVSSGKLSQNQANNASCLQSMRFKPTKHCLKIDESFKIKTYFSSHITGDCCELWNFNKVVLNSVGKLSLTSIIMIYSFTNMLD